MMYYFLYQIIKTYTFVLYKGKKNEESDIYESYIAFDETYVYDNTQKGLDIT